MKKKKKKDTLIPRIDIREKLTLEQYASMDQYFVQNMQSIPCCFGLAHLLDVNRNDLTECDVC